MARLERRDAAAVHGDHLRAAGDVVLEEGSP
jgi:hypothetical protein